MSTRGLDVEFPGDATMSTDEIVPAVPSNGGVQTPTCHGEDPPIILENEIVPAVPSNGGVQTPTCHGEDPPIILEDCTTCRRGSGIAEFSTSFGANQEEIMSQETAETAGVRGAARNTAASELQRPMARSEISWLEVVETLAAVLLTFLKYLVANGWPLVLIWYTGQGLVHQQITNYTIGQDGLAVTQPLIRCHERALTQAMWASLRPKRSADNVIPATKCQPNAVTFVFGWQRFIHPEFFCPGCGGELQTGFDLFGDNDDGVSKVLDGETPPTWYRVSGCPGSSSNVTSKADSASAAQTDTCPGGLHVDTEASGGARQNETLYALHFPEYRLRHDLAQRARLYMLPIHVWLFGMLSMRVIQFCRGGTSGGSWCKQWSKVFARGPGSEPASESTFAASARIRRSLCTGCLEKAFRALCAYDGRRGEFLAWYLGKFQHSVQYRATAWVTYMFIVGMLGYGAWDILTNAARPSVAILIQEGFLLILAAKELRVPEDVNVVVDLDCVAFREATLGWSALLFDAEAAVRRVERAVLFDSEPRLRRAVTRGADGFQPKDFKALEAPTTETESSTVARDSGLEDRDGPGGRIFPSEQPWMRRMSHRISSIGSAASRTRIRDWGAEHAHAEQEMRIQSQHAASYQILRTGSSESATSQIGDAEDPAVHSQHWETHSTPV